MIKWLQKKYALSEQGAKDLIKGCLTCVFQNISFIFPAGLLYCLVINLMNNSLDDKQIIQDIFRAFPYIYHGML